MARNIPLMLGRLALETSRRVLIENQRCDREVLNTKRSQLDVSPALLRAQVLPKFTLERPVVVADTVERIEERGAEFHRADHCSIQGSALTLGE